MTDRELDALLAEIRANRPKPPPDPAPPPPEPELHARLDTARTFLGAMFLTLTLLGGFFGFVLVDDSYRAVGFLAEPPSPPSARRRASSPSPGRPPRRSRSGSWTGWSPFCSRGRCASPPSCCSLPPAPPRRR